MKFTTEYIVNLQAGKLPFYRTCAICLMSIIRSQYNAHMQAVHGYELLEVTMHPLDELASRCYHDNKKKGFWEAPTTMQECKEKNGDAVLDVFVLSKPQYVNLKKMEKVMLIVTELSEGVEGIRKDLPSDKIAGFTSEEEEMADALIRILDYAGGFNLRLGAAFEAKLAYNASREYKHGKKF